MIKPAFIVGCTGLAAHIMDIGTTPEGQPEPWAFISVLGLSVVAVSAWMRWWIAEDPPTPRLERPGCGYCGQHKCGCGGKDWS